MSRRLIQTFAVIASTVAFVTVGVTTAIAGGGTAMDEVQILDVSKQIAGIEKKMNDLLAHGRWARAGRLLAGADCGYGDPSSVFAAWGDTASYALAPQGDLSPSDDWALNK